jgi:hypothetical protein
MSEMVPLKSGRQCADQFWISRLPTSLRFLPRDGGRGFHEHCRVGRPQGRGILIGRVCGHLANEHHKRMAKRAVFTPQAIEGGKAATA